MNRRAMGTVLAAVLIALVAPTTPASAAVVANRFESYYNTGECLDYSGTQGVYTTKCNTGPYQQWIWNNGDGVATPMRQVATDKCLATNAGGDLYMATCNSNDPLQRWYVTPRPGIPFLKSAALNYQCVTEWPESVTLDVCETGIKRQRWIVRSLA